MSVVLLTMDSHLASAATHAGERLAADLPGLNLQTHSASSWRDSDKALAACLSAIAQADIVIVTMLFMEDHFLPVLDALQARREHCGLHHVCAPGHATHAHGQAGHGS